MPGSEYRGIQELVWIYARLIWIEVHMSDINFGGWHSLDLAEPELFAAACVLMQDLMRLTMKSKVGDAQTQTSMKPLFVNSFNQFRFVVAICLCIVLASRSPGLVFMIGVLLH